MNGLAVDGLAMNVTAASKSFKETITSVPDPSLTFEFNELKRKLERKDIEIKRKDKEIQGYQKEVARLNKDSKLASSEMQSLRERNEQLQQSLMNSRIQSQSTKDDANSRHNTSRIRELESALGTATHKFDLSEVELEAAKKTISVVEEKCHELMKEIDLHKMEKDHTTKELDEMLEKIHLADQVEESRRKKISELENAMQLINSSNLSCRDRMETMTVEKEAQDKVIADLREEVKRLKIMLTTRGDTNSALQNQIDEISRNNIFLTKKEHERLLAIEIENKALVERSRDLVKSVDLHIDLLRRAEEDHEKLKKSYSEIKPQMVTQAGKLEDAKKLTAKLATSNKILKDEITTLRKEKHDLSEKLEYAKTHGVHDQEINTMKSGLAALARSKQEEIEAKLEERKRRRIAEESAKALKNRVSFLLDQLEVASKISVSWQEQREVSQSEINSLHKTNQILRDRLVGVQKNYMDRHSSDLVDPDFNERLASQPMATSAFMTEYVNSPTRNRSTTANNNNSSSRSSRGPSPSRQSDDEDESAPDDTFRTVVGMGGLGLGLGLGAAGRRNNVSVTDILTGTSKLDITALGGVFASQRASTLPTSAESTVERLLFDTICAFSSGRRQLGKKRKKRMGKVSV